MGQILNDFGFDAIDQFLWRVLAALGLKQLPYCNFEVVVLEAGHTFLEMML
jgi:hypothetical protein